jgi:hypothetical protein
MMKGTSMSVINEVTMHLRRHAEGSSNADDPTLLADNAWMFKHGSFTKDFKPIWADIVKHLEQLNVEMKRLTIDEKLPRNAVYAVSGMLNQCFSISLVKKIDPNIRQQFLELGWKISCGWDAILAGDVDNIAEYVE